jgi:tetratricopeptide (TPR) repeat protein
MTRDFFTSLFLLGLVCSATAQPSTDASGVGWNECFKAPTRACVLREAAEIARTIGDPRLAANALGQIAEVQSKAGLSVEAAATIGQALQVAKSIADDGYLRDNAIAAIAKVRAKAGNLTDALDAVGSIKNPYVQAKVLGAVAVAEGKAGRLDEALRRVQAIENLRDRALIMRRVAWDLGASAVARGEDDKIAAALADVQAIEQQYHLWPLPMTGIHHPSEFIPALAIIAQAQARAGKVAEAMRALRSVTRSRERARAFATIATELVRAGAVASALKVARSVDDRWERGVVLGLVLEPRPMPELIADEATSSGSSVKAETPDEVRDVVAAFTDREQRATVLGIVAVASANAGRLAEAIEFTEPIDQGEPRVFAWHAIAKAQAKAGLTAQSSASFERAVQAALSFEPHDQLLSNIATSQAEAGEIDEALRITQLIGSTMATAGSLSGVMVDGKLVNTDHDRRRALLAIAKAQAKAGRTAEALQGARALSLGPDIIPQALGVVAEGLAEVGRITEAIDAAAAEGNTFRRSELLASIAKARTAAGRIDEAKQVTQHITRGLDQVEALASIGAAEVKAGLAADALASFAEAMRIAHALAYKNLATEALMKIAARLPD